MGLLLVLFAHLGSAQATESRPVAFRHHLVMLDRPEILRFKGPPSGPPGPDAKGATVFLSEPLSAPMPFHELLVSWNLDVSAGAGAAVDLRVAATDGDWSPWLEVGRWGNEERPDPSATACDAGKVDVDYFRAARPQARAQVRVQAWPGGTKSPPFRFEIHRLAFCFTQRGGGAAGEARIAADTHLAWPPRIAVPFRSQTVEAKDIAPRICSPTSLSMVLAFRGVDRKTREVADTAWDSRHGIYGNWPRNVQAAWSLGVPGYLTRFADWGEVRDHLARGQPLIISIAAKKGDLTGAPYRATDGHLLVLCGFDEKGDVAVNDPAAPDAARGQVVYRRAEIEKVWMARGGTAYVLLPRRGT